MIANGADALTPAEKDLLKWQQIELRGFTLDRVPEIWEKLRGVGLNSLQTGMDNVRNINGCALARHPVVAHARTAAGNRS